MPTYEYECDKGHRFELFQSMKEDAISECVECGAKARRLIGPGAGFLFRGDGFYITDYRSKEYKQKAKDDGGKVEKKSDVSKSDSGSKSKETKSGGTKGGSGGTKDSGSS
ncbi:MAG: zinc ribbon domain-containing protein [Candidatus Latescibacterota bacterium]|nr:MAG: zinc ribbon domain-containing protein [Candidatus Latescibacterota bacterium]